MPTTIVWNSPMRELIGSVMVSSPLLLTFGTLSLLLYFRLPSTFLPSKVRSITTLGTRWHDFFFITRFRYFTIVLFFTLHFFSFSQRMQTRERAHCARSVFPFIKKKKKKVHPCCSVDSCYNSRTPINSLICFKSLLKFLTYSY